jgi:hypothetical protein
MKKLLTILTFLAITLTVLGQREMVVVGDDIYIDGSELSLTDAGMVAMILSPNPRSHEAYEHFKQAKALRDVRKLMVVAGVWQMITGTVYISYSPTLGGVYAGAFKFSIGSVLLTTELPLVDARRHVHMGVEAYNKALTKI